MLVPSLAALAICASALAIPVKPRRHTSLNARDDLSCFVSVRDGSFYKADKPYYLTSMNYWSAMNLAADDENGGNRSRFEMEVKQMAEVGINNVRIMASSEGSQFGKQPFRMDPPLMASPGKYNEAIFKGLDHSLATFAKFNMTVTMTLSNFWHWSGGAGQYVSWAENSTIPYPPSWDPKLNAPYGNYTSGGNWTVYTDYASRFYNDTSISNKTQQWYRDHIKTVVERVNSCTGVAYKDDPTIMTWELMNEPQAPNLEWVDSTASYIKSLAPKQLVTPGFESYQGKYWFDSVHASKNVDYATGHLWVQNRGYYNMSDPSEENFQNALTNGTLFLGNLSEWTMALGKPIVLEEFGMARDNWQNVAKGAPTEYYLYSAEATTTNKDRFFQAIIGSVIDYYKRDDGKSWAGTGPWAYGGQWRPFDKVNQFQESWAGDPPHEAPGWYDVYDSDKSTLAIIKAQSINATAIIDSRR